MKECSSVSSTGGEPCHLRYGDYDPNDCDVTVEVRDAASGRTLWSTHFAHETPDFMAQPQWGRMILVHPAGAPDTDAAVAAFPQWRSAWATDRQRPGTVFLEVRNLADGQVRGTVVVSSPAAGRIAVVGQDVLLRHPGYGEIFSLASGARLGEVPLTVQRLSPDGCLALGAGPSSDQANALAVYAVGARGACNPCTSPPR